MERRGEEMYQGKWSMLGYFQSRGHVAEGICFGMKSKIPKVLNKVLNVHLQEFVSILGHTWYLLPT